MPDATYPSGGQGVYRSQGGRALVVGSSGTITVEAGGSITLGSSAYIADTVTTGSSGVTLPNSGHAVLTGGTTATGAKTYPVAAPVAGCVLTAHVTVANVSDCALLDIAPATLSGLGTQDLIRLSTHGDFVTIRGLSTSAWAITSRTPTSVTTTS